MTTEAMMQMLLEGQTPTCVADQMAALAQSNPKLAPLLTKMQERMARQAQASQSESVEKNDAAETTVDDAAREPEIQSLTAAEKAVADLKRLARRMFAELQTLRTRNDTLADALGACPLCWGEDHACPQCGGDGSAGAFVIDREIFTTVVGPAVQQVRQRPNM